MYVIRRSSAEQCEDATTEGFQRGQILEGCNHRAGFRWKWAFEKCPFSCLLWGHWTTEKQKLADLGFGMSRGRHYGYRTQGDGREDRQ